VPEEERAYVRGATEALLLRDPSERIALHGALLMANVARFDVPRRWPGLLASLGAAARWEEAGTSVVAKTRALRALKHVVAALGGTRACAGGAGAAAEDARATRAAGAALFPLIAAEWRAHAAAATAGDVSHARLALRCLPVLRGLFRLLPSLSAPELHMTPLMEAFLSHLSAGVDTPPPPPGAHLPPDDPSALSAKHFRLIAECVAAAMDSYPRDFAPFLAPFVAVFTRGVLSLPQTALGDDPKRAHALTRFLANALLAPEYKVRRAPPPATQQLGGGMDGEKSFAPDSPPDSPPPLVSADDLDIAFGRAPRRTPEEEASAAAAATAAEAAFAPLFESDAMVRALVERYLVPTQAELDEWCAVFVHVAMRLCVRNILAVFCCPSCAYRRLILGVCFCRRADPEALLAAGEPAAAGADAVRVCASRCTARDVLPSLSPHFFSDSLSLISCSPRAGVAAAVRRDAAAVPAAARPAARVRHRAAPRRRGASHTHRQR
jgi:hypothetical protein